jgi:hypothetical protein
MDLFSAFSAYKVSAKIRVVAPSFASSDLEIARVIQPQSEINLQRLAL